MVVYDVRNAKLDGALERHGRYEDGGETVEVGLSLEHLFGFVRVAEMMHGSALRKILITCEQIDRDNRRKNSLVALGRCLPSCEPNQGKFPVLQTEG